MLHGCVSCYVTCYKAYLDLLQVRQADVNNGGPQLLQAIKGEAQHSLDVLAAFIQPLQAQKNTVKVLEHSQLTFNSTAADVLAALIQLLQAEKH
jgi:hypothetical protein